MLYQQSTLLKMLERWAIKKFVRKQSEEFDMTLHTRWEGQEGNRIDNSIFLKKEMIDLEVIIFESHELCSGIHHHVLLYNGSGCYNNNFISFGFIFSWEFMTYFLTT